MYARRYESTIPSRAPGPTEKWYAFHGRPCVLPVQTVRNHSSWASRYNGHSQKAWFRLSTAPQEWQSGLSASSSNHIISCVKAQPMRCQWRREHADRLTYERVSQPLFYLTLIAAQAWSPSYCHVSYHHQAVNAVKINSKRKYTQTHAFTIRSHILLHAKPSVVRGLMSTLFEPVSGFGLTILNMVVGNNTP